MPILSETRWLARIDMLSWLMQHYTENVDAMEQICMESSGQPASDATSYKFSLLSFQFIISVVIIQFVLGYSRALSVALQATVDCDLIAAHDDARTVVRALENLREGTRFLYQQLYDIAVELASKLDVLPQKSRTTGKQTRRSRPNIGSRPIPP